METGRETEVFSWYYVRGSDVAEKSAFLGSGF